MKRWRIIGSDARWMSHTRQSKRRVVQGPEMRTLRVMSVARHWTTLAHLCDPEVVTTTPLPTGNSRWRRARSATWRETSALLRRATCQRIRVATRRCRPTTTTRWTSRQKTRYRQRRPPIQIFATCSASTAASSSRRRARTGRTAVSTASEEVNATPSMAPKELKSMRPFGDVDGRLVAEAASPSGRALARMTSDHPQTYVPPPHSFRHL